MEFSGSDEKKAEILGKILEIRNILTQRLNKPTGNLQVLETLLEMWSSQEVGNASDEQSIHVPDPIPSTYVKARKKDVNQKIFMCAEDSLKRYKEVVEAHSRYCKHNLIIEKWTTRGHVIMTRMKCESSHTFLWSSSPYMQNKEYLVNNRVQHGLICSGMLPSHYTKFVDEYHKSTTTALLEESASYYDDKFGEIDILTDARHGWRKNAKDASIVAIGEKTHKVLSCQHVTKADDVVSQRHERIGTNRVCTYLAEKEAVGVHCHDRNLSINKYIREETDAINQNDTWHCVKAVKTALKKVAAGTAKSERKTWSFQLSDKVEPVSTHIHWAIRNCNNDPEKLKSSILNVVDHYKNRHLSCDPSSRCKYDKNYKPSRIVLTDPVAEKLLLGDKRIAFSDKQYNARSNLAVCQWNENVDRDFTSISNPRNPRTPRSVRLKDIDAEMFVLNENETMKLHDVQKVLIGRLLCDRNGFQWFKNKPPTTYTTSVQN
ncbi:unnamed protein product [Mytilus coruscus]|uniref:Mutator-like transposase domain-containing protein n=1 Tax=Mytilus coruscus TaxID=42192 RepID=A0A6J8BPB3_MYTCO|nr:unnamed protein product [Mytilus coruscus]